jgi:hypothetical protein
MADYNSSFNKKLNDNENNSNNPNNGNNQNTENNQNIEKRVLKNDFNFNYSDYQKLKIAEQYNELYTKQFTENTENEKIVENKKIYNLSLNDLFKNTSVTLSSLLNDLVIFYNQDNKTLNEFILIFTKQQRLIYLGILIILFAFSLWLIDVSK